jgi:hypothetical protein
MGWMVNATSSGDIKHAYKILIGKFERKRPLRRPRRRGEDNIRIQIRETGWEGVDWTYLDQERDQWRTVVKMVMYLRVA